MANFTEELSPALEKFIAAQHVFFVATAASEGGRVNLSPKGIDTFRVFDSKRVGYLDLTGSGNETAAHARENGRLTFMFCSFEGPPLILRLYGRGRAVHRSDPGWAELHARFRSVPGERQIVLMDIESVQTSCGKAVPTYGFEGHRNALIEWAEERGDEGLASYRAGHNGVSIDGIPAGFSE